MDRPRKDFFETGAGQEDPAYRGPRSPMVSKGLRLLLICCPGLSRGPSWRFGQDEGPHDTLKELSWLQEASYVSKENRYGDFARPSKRFSGTR